MGMTRLLVDPDLDKMAKEMVARQLSEMGAKRTGLQAAVDTLAEKANISTERTLETIREGLEDAKKCFGAIQTPAQLHAFIERFVGPSVARSDGTLMARVENEGGTGNNSSASSTVAATGFEPVT